VTTLDAIGYGVLAILVIVAFGSMAHEIWTDRRTTRRPDPPPQPRPPVDPLR
jgi:hypothetical protein